MIVESLIKWLRLQKKIHSKGYYHGDCNPSKFYDLKDKVKILDTQAKKNELWKL